LLKTMVLIPVIALRVLETDESIPPDIPMTNDWGLVWHLINVCFDPIRDKFYFF